MQEAAESFGTRETVTRAAGFDYFVSYLINIEIFVTCEKQRSQERE